MKVLFATAELAPMVSVGGLAEASAGVVAALRGRGIDVSVVLPDYFGFELTNEQRVALDVPDWAGSVTARFGSSPGAGPVVLVDAPGVQRPNPYVDEHGQGWEDNADRFFAFSAAVASLAKREQPDILHLNDWHTAAALGLDADLPASVLTIHTLGHQGWTSGGWLDRLVEPEPFEAHGGTNPLKGGIQLADAVIAVSPNYAREITTPQGGEGLDETLRGIGDRLVGIRNGIDTETWNPETDEFIAAQFSKDELSEKARAREALLDVAGWVDDGSPVVGMVTRLVAQKGVEFALEAARFADSVPFKLLVLGSGDQWLADWARHEAASQPDRVWFYDGFNAELAHQVFAGSDLLLMPSRFEPCGLAQMQAMTYGTIPVVSPVGGLVDTVTDADEDRRGGTGFRMKSVDAAGAIDGLHRAVRAWRHPARRQGIQRRGMDIDWSWDGPAADYIDLYERISRS